MFVASGCATVGGPLPEAERFVTGADLSYLNQMLDCGAEYRVDGEVRDPYEILAAAGAEVARVRLWHSPSGYSGLEDATRALRRARDAGMRGYLDFHYSDTWADPAHQAVPEAWRHFVSSDSMLADAVYGYTLDVLRALRALDLTPAFVQLGNELNSGLLWRDGPPASLDWPRTALLVNAGLRAVRDFSRENSEHVLAVLHVAQPENAFWWFSQARAAGIVDFDAVGLSYYPQWSEHDLGSLGEALRRLQAQVGKPVMVVETGYPWTLEHHDDAHDVLGRDALLPGYPPSPAGQARFLRDLASICRGAGALGLLYWEPGWVSTPCSTPWGVGSHWDNATLFDASGEALPGLEFLRVR